MTMNSLRGDIYGRKQITYLPNANEVLQVQMVLEVRQNLNTKDNPCEMDEGYSVTKETEKYWTDEIS